MNENASSVNSDASSIRKSTENTTIGITNIQPNTNGISNDSSSEELSDESSEAIDYSSRAQSIEKYKLLQKSLACVKCDSKTNGSDCMYADDMKYLGHCFNEIGQCYTIIDNNGDVSRGCVGDEMVPDFQTSARKYSDSIKFCNNGRFCNQEMLLDTCIVCSGAECAAPSLEMEKVCSFGLAPKGCYLKINSINNSYERGCLQRLLEKEQDECKEPGSKYCQSCSNRNCNQKVNFNQICHFCDGTSYSNCYREVNGATTTCIGYSSICLTGNDGKGFTHRQCSQNDKEDALRFPNGYETCYTDRCNSNIFPKVRITCYRCERGSKCDHPSVELKGHMCRAHPDECFIYGKNGKEFEL